MTFERQHRLIEIVSIFVAAFLLSSLLLASQARSASAQSGFIAVDANVTCVAADGTIDVGVTNYLQDASGVPIDTTVITIEFSPGGAATTRNLSVNYGVRRGTTVSGRRDGLITITASSPDGPGIFGTQTVTVDCDDTDDDIEPPDGGGGVCDYLLFVCSLNPSNAVGELASAGVSAAVNSVVDGFSNLMMSLLRQSLRWWTTVGVGDQSGVVGILSSQFMWLSLTVVLIGFLVQCGRIIVGMGSGEPMARLLKSTLTFVAVNGVWWPLIQLFSVGTDLWAHELLTGASTNQALAIIEAISRDTTYGFGVAVLSILMAITSAILALMALIRSLAVQLLAALIPLGAAGGMLPWGKSWLPSLTSRLIGLLLWKPVAAGLIYAGLVTMAQGQGIIAMVMGIGLFTASIISLPLLTKVFSHFQFTSDNSGWSGSAQPPVGGATTMAVAGAKAYQQYKMLKGNSGRQSSFDPPSGGGPVPSTRPSAQKGGFGSGTGTGSTSGIGTGSGGGPGGGSGGGSSSISVTGSGSGGGSGGAPGGGSGGAPGGGSGAAGVAGGAVGAAGAVVKAGAQKGAEVTRDTTREAIEPSSSVAGSSSTSSSGPAATGSTGTGSTGTRSAGVSSAAVGSSGAAGRDGATGAGQAGATGAGRAGATGAGRAGATGAGRAGATGAGRDGVRGDAGSIGGSGQRGDVGGRGESGWSGRDGMTGDGGSAGTSGRDGVRGDLGVRGSSGLDGTAGERGTSGSGGASGAVGAAGLDGAAGERGTSGSGGASGAVGAAGLDGIDGTGRSGPTGEDGAAGSRGSDGSAGPTGESGPSGSDSPPKPNAPAAPPPPAPAGSSSLK